VSRGRDDGSATLWVLGCVPVLLLVVLAAVLRGAAVTGRHAAETAADLAALAAAGRIGTSAAPCPAARRWADANGAHLVGCTTTLDADGRSGTVEVSIMRPVRLPVLGVRQVAARARAARLPWDRCGMLACAEHRLLTTGPSSVEGWLLSGTLRVEAGRG
jgi:secretion/DNA translocation related TadE-like protein